MTSASDPSSSPLELENVSPSRPLWLLPGQLFQHPRRTLTPLAYTDPPHLDSPRGHHHLPSVNSANLPLARLPLQELTFARHAVLIERAQFAHNPRMYTKDGFADVLHRDGFTGSWLEWLLRETETSHGALPLLSSFTSASLTVPSTARSQDPPLRQVRTLVPPRPSRVAPRRPSPRLAYID